MSTYDKRLAKLEGVLNPDVCPTCGADRRGREELARESARELLRIEGITEEERRALWLQQWPEFPGMLAEMAGAG